MAKTSILILDDERRWRGELREVLTDAGLDCTAISFGEVAVETVRQDHGHKIKIVLADELLLEPDVPDGDRQHLQGSDVRKLIYAIRPDIKFIVISQMPLDEAKKHSDPEQAAITALEKRGQLSGGTNVIAMFDKFGLRNPSSSIEEYKKLIQKIRLALGEPKANIKPALFIGLGLERSQYEDLAKVSEIKKGDEFRLHKLCEKYGSDRARYVDKFLREQAFGKGVKQFLEVLAQEATGSKKPERNLDHGTVKYICTFIRKPNSARLLPSPIKVGSSEFRVFFMLAYRAEKGESPLIREEDYVYKDRRGQVSNLGAGISQYSLNQSAADAYGAIDDSDDNDDISFELDEEMQRYVAEDMAYEFDKSSGRRKQKAEIVKEQSKLKLPVTRARAYLKKDTQETATLELQTEIDSETGKACVIYVPTFITGIILYPVDREVTPQAIAKK
ncbi:hypothetical protein [Pseudanabaena sp. UWO310]|uniref:hypothetical protein n=1 Tax=Pseudanabaena sp. UWO310 TaxID=2480795 RepID=UPI00115A844E|nr:hypothetical protein [Pseudanabaena sp. UWO310]TYQ30495.1 hypothetical protein PseudUWO310_08215 [Pseudanabaena sp. UWO310]